jgi:hypothetical protein
MQIADRGVRWKITNRAATLVFQALQFERMGDSCKFPSESGMSLRRTKTLGFGVQQYPMPRTFIFAFTI